ncbi:Urocanate reductase [anaerobic digester metagenome]
MNLKKRMMSLMVAGLMTAGLAACTTTPPTTTPAGTAAPTTTAVATTTPSTTPPATTAPTGEIKFKPGTYKGEAEGFHGPIKVEVTLSETAITDIKVEQTETEGVGDKAIESIVALIKSGTTLKVDAVSGATYSSKGILEAVTAALTSAGADIEALKNKTAGPGGTTGDVEKTTDVVIIGGGGAGLSAAMSAHENGAKVIVLEKMSRLGGNTIISGAAYNAADPKRQAALTMTDLEKKTVEGILEMTFDDAKVKTWQETLKQEWKEYTDSKKTTLFDSPSMHKLQTYLGGDKKGNPELIDVLCENTYPTIEWLEAKGMLFKDYIFTVLGGLWSRAHKPEKPLGTGFVQTYEDYIEKNKADIEVLLDTKAEDLVMEGGKIVGVIAQGKTGKVTVRASKGVIIATGGFGANVEMRNKYNTSLWPDLTNIKTTNHTGATGDGIAMAEKVNAGFTGMEYIQLLPMGDPETGSLSGNIEQGVQNRIFVNKEGKRFVDEGARRDVMTKALMEQTDSYMWVIVDKNSYPTGDTINNFNESIDDLVAAGRAFKGETLEELAGKIGVDPAAFVKSVEDFNKAVDGAKDEFGRTLFDKKLDTAPFYAGARVPTVHHTMGGITIDAQAHVLDQDGKAIPGLYAAGEVTGGIHGTNRLGGNALADINVFGRIAGQNAAGAK